MPKMNPRINASGSLITELLLSQFSLWYLYWTVTQKKVRKRKT